LKRSETRPSATSVNPGIGGPPINSTIPNILVVVISRGMEKLDVDKSPTEYQHDESTART
jgi:hypothetical protein